MRPLALGCSVLLLVLGTLFGQSKTTAVLSGTITDPSGAVVPGANVTAVNIATNVRLEAASDDHGQYRILQLPPGAYDVRVEHPGFSVQTRKSVELTVGQMATIDFRLSVGESQQVVEVQARPLAIETERTQLSDTVGTASVRNLPINRRDYLTFALLMPGVSDSSAMADSNSFRVKQTPDSGLSFWLVRRIRG